jgi:uncharacterized protein (UPF0335 family)
MDEQLQSFFDRIDNQSDIVDAEKALLKEIYAEAKSTGFDTQIMKKVVALRKKSGEQRAEEQALIDIYLNALGL